MDQQNSIRKKKKKKKKARSLGSEQSTAHLLSALNLVLSERGLDNFKVVTNTSNISDRTIALVLHSAVELDLEGTLRLRMPVE